MQNYSPSMFFDLSNCAYRALFDDIEYVWQALDRIRVFLANSSLGNIEAIVEPGATLINREEISIGEGSIVEAGAYIKGPCLIGKNCQIRHGAYVRGNVVVGDHCVIGHATEVKNSILLSGAKAAHFAYVGDSILGNDTNLGAGTKCANVRLDQGNIFVRQGDVTLDTNRKKLGAIIGDRTQTGCNSVLNPATFLKKNSKCLPCAHVKGYIEEQQGESYV